MSDHSFSRRQFIKASAAAAAASALPLGAAPAVGGKGSVSIVMHDEENLKTPLWLCALVELRDALQERGVTVSFPAGLDKVPPLDVCILGVRKPADAGRQALAAAGAPMPEEPESLAMAWTKMAGKSVLFVGGADPQGLKHALL